jgi:hypothetical protein
MAREIDENKYLGSPEHGMFTQRNRNLCILCIPALGLRDMKSNRLEIRLDGGHPSLIYHFCLTTCLGCLTSYCSLRVGVSRKQSLIIHDLICCAWKETKDLLSPNFLSIFETLYYYAVAPMVQSVTRALVLKASGIGSILLVSKASQHTCLESKWHVIDPRTG